MEFKKDGNNNIYISVSSILGVQLPVTILESWIIEVDFSSVSEQMGTLVGYPDNEGIYWSDNNVWEGH